MARANESAEIRAIGDRWAELQAVLNRGGLSDVEITSIKRSQDLLHQEAERLRAIAGYSGGSDGSEVILIEPNPKDNPPSYTQPPPEIDSGEIIDTTFPEGGGQFALPIIYGIVVLLFINLLRKVF